MYTEIMCRDGQKATKEREDLAAFQSRQKMVKSEQDTSNLDSSSLHASSTFTGLARSTAYKLRQYDKSNPILDKYPRLNNPKCLLCKNTNSGTPKNIKRKPGVKIPNDPPLKVSPTIVSGMTPSKGNIYFAGAK
jgi:hypothetical protein